MRSNNRDYQSNHSRRKFISSIPESNFAPPVPSFDTKYKYKSPNQKLSNFPVLSFHAFYKQKVFIFRKI